jgi:hypothetical protein
VNRRSDAISELELRIDVVSRHGDAALSMVTGISQTVVDDELRYLLQILAICFYLVHSRFERRWRPSVAALFSTILVAILVIGPILAVASAFVSEALRVLEYVPKLTARAPESVLRWIRAALS